MKSPLIAAALVAASLVTAAILSGCGSQAPQAPATSEAREAPSGVPSSPTPSQPSSDEEHGHKPGAHGGIIVSIGVDSYHAEAVVEKSGTFRLFLLGRDESRIQEVEAQNLTAYVKATGDSEAVPIEIKPARQEGDAEGKTSQFAGELPANVVGKPIDVTIPNLRIGDERFRVGFMTKSEPAHAEDMPDSIPAEEERVLYLTPGGKYTAEDIRANGNVVASVRFKGVRSLHDMKPKPGDKICPVTLTKANPRFSWVVGGNTYEFCCPPCVDEFVRLAKESPDEIKNPSEYVKP